MRAPAYFVGVALSFVLLRREALDPTHGGSHAKAADGEPATSSPAPAGSTLGGIFKRALPLAIPLAAMGVLVYVQVSVVTATDARPLLQRTTPTRGRA